MALPVHCSFPFLLQKPLGLSPRAAKWLIKCQEASSEPAPEKSVSASSGSAAGVGFGSSKQQRSTASGKGERATVIRRRPLVEQPDFVSRTGNNNGKEPGRNENAFLLTWSGLGAIILAQGLTLSASGFLPEEWDRFVVKYLYPSFTPTVGFFVAGTVAYGVLKYLQNDQLKK